jgi:Holliday junction resolvase RusA-like endonuclease
LLPFEFIIEGPPVSQQARRRRRIREWKERVRNAAASRWPPADPLENGNIEIKISYFYESSSPDVDNIVKPIQDALIGLVYHDDRQIVRSTSEKKKIDGSYRIRGMSPVLAEGFVSGREFLHILVQRPQNMEVLS